MFEKASYHLVANGNINTEDRELYEYGLRQGILSIINLMTAILIGYLLGMVWQSIIYMISYIPLRTFAGGFHTRTQFRCYLFSIYLILGVLLANRYIPGTSYNVLILTIISCIIIICLSPVEDSNKPLDKTERIVYRRRTIYILITEILTIILLISLGFPTIAMSISISLFALCFMLILGSIKIR
ncbi:MAG: accessory gene regulator B family protein [Herbinix sp.]|nr:accessory gene regulator B family protein [Herbinix sp.]